MKELKNRMSRELLEWARARHGRFAKIAEACGVSKRQVFAWSVGECGIAPRHHAKIFEESGGILPTEISSIETDSLKKMWDFYCSSDSEDMPYEDVYYELNRRGHGHYCAV